MSNEPLDFYQQAFQRNLGLVQEAEQDVLRRSCVAVAGLGGVGGLHLVTLARMGIGRFHIADYDAFEVVNFNRQYGATTHTVGRKKADVMREMVASINPNAEITVFDQGINKDNIDAFLSGVDAVVDGIDFFSVDVRRMLFNEARKRGLYVVTAGPIGFGAALQIFSPTGMSFDDYFCISDAMTLVEKLVAFAVGITPIPYHLRYMDLTKVDMSSGRGPSIASACALCSGLVATEVLNILLRKRPIKAIPHYFQFDPFKQVYKKGYMLGGGKNLWLVLMRWILMKRVKRLFLKNGHP